MEEELKEKKEVLESRRNAIKRTVATAAFVVPTMMTYHISSLHATASLPGKSGEE
jgi:hypothetical protein